MSGVIICPLVACGMFASVPAGLCTMLLARWFDSLGWFVVFPALWLIWTVLLCWLLLTLVV